MKKSIQLNPYNAHSWYLLARAHADIGQIPLANYATAERYFLLGEKNVCSVLGDKCDKHGVNYEYCNKGYEDDLYSRYKVYLSKLNKSYDFFIRMTADNYLIQPLVVKKMIKDFISNKWDYSYVKPLSHYACEIVKIDSFLNNLDYNRENLEHITPSFRNKKKKI